MEKRGEYATVAAIFSFRVGERSVAFEDCNPEGRHWDERSLWW